MIEIIDLFVRGNSFPTRYATQKIPLKAGDYCLVESPIGIQIARVKGPARIHKDKYVNEKLPKVLRKASEDDLNHLKLLERLEEEAFNYCAQKIASRSLEMKLIRVVFAFDQSKGLFMFTSESRVDFRELVRDLAHQYKNRIEMKQVGVRDEARLLGGIGNCGCVLCCTTFLRDFQPVSIKMAKDQGLSLIPSKISGVCGRLMCCLQYEHVHYAEQIKLLPRIGKRVMTPKGEGRVRQLNILKGRVLVELPNEELEEYSGEELSRIARGEVEDDAQIPVEIDETDGFDARPELEDPSLRKDDNASPSL